MNETTSQEWRRAASNLMSCLRSDNRSALRRADPWGRAAASMVGGWQIRLSRPPLKNNAKVSPRPTWRVFAKLAAAIVTCKKNRAHKSDWYLWASRRVSGGSRYIPKKDRHWENPAHPTAPCP